MLISIATITILIAIVTLLIIHETTANNYAQWSFQQRLFVPEAGIDYGKSPATLFGRGFRTLISGYTEEGNALYVHTTDEGYAYQGREIWTLQAKLVPNDGVVGDLFGKSVVSSDKTLIVSSPQHNRARGAIYVFNGTGRYWSQQQKIVAFDSFVNDLFGDSMALHNDRLVVSAKTLSTLGSAYVFERSSGGIFWSLQARLQPMDPGINQFFASKVRLHGDFVIASSRNDENAGDQTGSVYIFQVTNGIWSQQQKLFSEDFQNWNQGDFLNVSIIN